MPLGFNTESHGEIPIGFFNIDTDMILINNYFVFASDFCNWIIEWTKSEDEYETEKEFYVISKLETIGNLMGAIAGMVYTGFIGEVYKKFPFPKNLEDFKQKPDGYKNRKTVEKIIQKFTKPETISIIISWKERQITIGEYVFSREQFHEVISYIWRGGMPKWKADEKPEYVREMMKAVISTNHWLFNYEPTE